MEDEHQRGQRIVKKNARALPRLLLYKGCNGFSPPFRTRGFGTLTSFSRRLQTHARRGSHSGHADAGFRFCHRRNPTDRD